MAKRQNNIVVQKARTKFEFRSGSGYSINELKELGLNVKKARDMGIRVDLRRKTTYDKNIKFLMETYNLTREKITPKKEQVKIEKTKPKPQEISKKPISKKPEPKKSIPKPKVEEKREVETVQKAKKPTSIKTEPIKTNKKMTTEEFHKMYNEETGKNAIWRGKESGVYLKWLDKKKKDLGL